MKCSAFSVSLLLVYLFQYQVFASNYVAEVVKLRGDVTQLSPGALAAKRVNLGDKFLEDTSILTGPKSFVKLKYVDETEMNIGPDSKIVISEVKKDSGGIISLLKGQIRTQVQKDAKKPEENKFFVKTRTAALGVRGTEFQTVFNPENKVTSLVTFEGKVAMAKFDEVKATQAASKEKEIVRDATTNEVSIEETSKGSVSEKDVLNKALKSKDTVLVPEGLYSGTSENLVKASIPVKISPVQLNVLYKNEELSDKDSGIKAKEITKDDLSKVEVKQAEQTAPPEGFFNPKTGDFAPKAGGFLDLKTGLYIAPDASSEFDKKSGVYVAQNVGQIDADTGQYVPPQGLTLDAKKGFVVEEAAKNNVNVLALKEELNKTVAKDLVLGNEQDEKFDPNEEMTKKLIRHRLAFDITSGGDEITGASATSGTTKFHLGDVKDYQMKWNLATANKFSPYVAFGYRNANWKRDYSWMTLDSSHLMAMKVGVTYHPHARVRYFAQYGINQKHFYVYQDNPVTTPSTIPRMARAGIAQLDFGVEYSLIQKKKFELVGLFMPKYAFYKDANEFKVSGHLITQVGLDARWQFKEQYLGLGIRHESDKFDLKDAYTNSKQEKEYGGLNLSYGIIF